jgi:hypothetical protein
LEIYGGRLGGAAAAAGAGVGAAAAAGFDYWIDSSVRSSKAEYDKYMPPGSDAFKKMKKRDF